MIQKRFSSLSTKVKKAFYGMVKVRVIIMQNANIFTTYEALFENVLTILPITFRNKTPGKSRKCLVNLQELTSYVNSMQAI